MHKQQQQKADTVNSAESLKLWQKAWTLHLLKGTGNMPGQSWTNWDVTNGKIKSKAYVILRQTKMMDASLVKLVACQYIHIQMSGDTFMSGAFCLSWRYKHIHILLGANHRTQCQAVIAATDTYLFVIRLEVEVGVPGGQKRLVWQVGLSLHGPQTLI